MGINCVKISYPPGDIEIKIGDWIVASPVLNMANYSVEGVVAKFFGAHEVVSLEDLKEYFKLSENDSQYLRMSTMKSSATRIAIRKKGTAHYTIIPFDVKWNYSVTPKGVWDGGDKLKECF